MRQILHVDMDTFFVAVEQRLDPSLLGKPVIVGGHPEGRGVVAACSYEARAYGVHSAMPLAQALRLCPRAVFLRGAYDNYLRASLEVFRILKQFTPLVEPTSLDEAYLDVSACLRLHGHAMAIAETIHERIAGRLALPASVGLATSKTVAKVASRRAKPNGILRILPGAEAAFLAPLPLRELPGIGPSTAERLQSLGLRSIGELAHLPPAMLETVFGKTGRLLAQRARGIDASPVVTGSVVKSVGHETTFETDTADRQEIEAVLAHLTEKATRRLRRLLMQARTVTLKLRYADFTTVSRSRTLRAATDLDTEVYRTAGRLLRSLLTRRVRVRLLGISLSNLCEGERQLNLFDEGRCAKYRGFYRAVDSLRDRFGFDVVTVGRAALLQATVRRGERHLNPFRPALDQEERKKGEGTPEEGGPPFQDAA